jgi:hypothetical protein
LKIEAGSLRLEARGSGNRLEAGSSRPEAKENAKAIRWKLKAKG